MLAKDKDKNKVFLNMNNRLLISLLFLAAIACERQTEEKNARPVDFTCVEVTDQFWKPRIETNASVTIPHILAMCYEEGRVANFKRAAGLEEGRWQGHMGFDDTDVYKVIEGMSFTYSVTADEALRQEMDTLIYYIGKAQLPDGYLYTPYQLRARDYMKISCSYDKERYDNLYSSHEFYNMGHLYEAAVAHYTATGQRNFLDIAEKSAWHIWDVFGPGKREAISGHQEIETGLMKLAKVTDNTKYAELAKLLLDRRGHGIDGGKPYNQNHQPVVEQREAVGHAVRANYMYAAMTDVAILLDDEAYRIAVDSLWEDVVGRKIYITGGLGARHSGEAYGDAYELPNWAYAETCAAVAGVYWNQRMFQLHKESKYVDVLERILYNGLISGVSLDGRKFFYSNVLEANGDQPINRVNPNGRAAWFDSSCCPTNLVRFLSSLPGYVYAVDGASVYSNLYMSNQAEISLGNRTIRLREETDYPWSGHVRMDVEVDRPAKFTMKLRIPLWSQGRPLPGELYHYTDATPGEVLISVNGEQVNYEVKDGYANLTRKWKTGDRIEMEIPMVIHTVTADDRVVEDRGKVAFERGPVVYCFEQVDNPGLDELCPSSGPAQYRFEPDLLGGVGTLRFDDGAVAVPYAYWDNRIDDHMKIWL